MNIRGGDEHHETVENRTMKVTRRGRKLMLVSSRCSSSSRVERWRRGRVDNYCILMVAGSRLLFKPATLIFIRHCPRHHQAASPPQKPNHQHAACASRPSHTRSLCPAHHRPQHRAQHRSQRGGGQQRPQKAWPQSRPDLTHHACPPHLTRSRRLWLDCQWGMQQTSLQHGPLGRLVTISSRPMILQSRG